jgi:hypothetical protein
MSSEQRRSILSNLAKPSLAQPRSIATPAAEEKLLGYAEAPVAPAPIADVRKEKVPTTPVTFHLPIDLRDKLKITAQAKGTTMLELVREAIEKHLSDNPVSEADLRKLLRL